MPKVALVAAVEGVVVLVAVVAAEAALVVAAANHIHDQVPRLQAITDLPPLHLGRILLHDQALEAIA